MTWRADLEAALGARVAHAAPVAGGDVAAAFRAQLADGRAVFVKTLAAAPPDLFACEAAGLDWLRVGPLRVPRVLAHGPRFLALEFLDAGARAATFAADLGAGLAQLHALGAPAFGLARDNYVATVPQPNASLSDWPAFYVERRLRPLCPAALHAHLDALRARPDRFGPPEPPARLHGDLWWGNVLAVGGAPALIDPAVYGGHREIDLAMLALFGELPAALVDAYCEIHPLADGWRARVPLWQLYPLAVHAALFGGGYRARFAETLARCAV